MNPKVSVVIPCLNEEKYIGKCIQSILNSDYDKDAIEVFVCDGMSDDNTRNIVASFPQMTVHLTDNPERTTPYALNAGIRKAAGEIIIILGAHAEIDPAYISTCVETFSINPSIGCVGGLLETVSENEPTRAIAKAMSSPFGVGNAHFRTGAREGFVDTVAFGAYKREVFEKVGLFDEALTRNQDDEFNFRVLQAGYRIYLNPQIRAIYYARSSFAKLFRQYRQYGYWKVFVNRKHKTITTSRQLIPAGFLLFLSCGFLLGLIVPGLFPVYLAVLGIYLLGALYAATNVARLKEAGPVVLSFIILHISYGLGYLQGIVDFILLRKNPSGKSGRLTR